MRSRKQILFLVCLAAGSCSSTQPGIEVRASPVTRSSGVSDAEAHLALGNVALALEGFRKAIREQPTDTRALIGIAHSSERMGRFDLSRKWFETALAAMPADRSILQEFAAFLDRQRLPLEAAAVRGEVVERNQSSSPAAPKSPASEPTVLTATEIASSVTLVLPPPRRVDQREVVKPSVQNTSPASPRGPRLERLSLGEVALVTRSEPVWRGELVKRSPKSVTFRLVAVRPVARLLNAARQQGLAARTRASLVDRGWSRIEIGDAPAVREKSLVLFPHSQAATAKRLAAQFGFANLRPFNGPEIVVLLGRDAARMKGLRPA